MEFVWFVTMAYGLTQILVYGSIFDKIRPKAGKLGDLFRCPMCVGFWVGLFLWSISEYTSLINFDDGPLTALLCGFVSSGASYALSVLFGDNGLKLEKQVHVDRS